MDRPRVQRSWLHSQCEYRVGSRPFWYAFRPVSYQASADCAQGSCGAPDADDLARSVILLGLQTASGKQMIFKSLNAQHLLTTLLSCCKARNLVWDPRKDILYLCKNETKEVHRIHAQLNRTEVKELFLDTAFFSRLNIEDQRLCYQTLLVSEPLPIMDITPPALQAPIQMQKNMCEPEQIINARSPRSRHRKVDGQRSSSSGASGYVQGVQCVKSARPHSVSAVTAAKEARKSMPHLMTVYDTPSGTDSAQTTSTGETVLGIQSQKGSLHSVSPEQEQTSRQQYFEDTNASSHERLHVIGSERVYGAHEKPREAKQVQVEHQRHHSAPAVQKRTAPIFELDATTQPDVVFVAELPGNSVILPPPEQHTTRNDGILCYRTGIRPSDVGASPTPLEHGSLPASLVAGRPGTNIQHSSINLPGPSDASNADFSTRQTNAYRYSSYTLPSFVCPEPLSKEVTTPAYQAYRPFIATHGLSRTDSVSSVYSPAHKRNASDDSVASHDSDKLAREYQELLDFEAGYGSD